MKRILSIILILIAVNAASAQIEVDSMFIFQNIKNGGTTASLQYEHKLLDSLQSQNEKLSQQDVEILRCLFENSKKKRFIQQKHGGEIIHAIIWFQGRRYNYIIEGNSNFVRMVNLSTMRKWTLTEPEKVKALNILVKSRL